METRVVGRWFGIVVSVAPSTYGAMLAVWAFWSIVAIFWFQIPVAIALLFGPLAVLLHWFSDLVHQFGHVWAARRTGYPMAGLRFWGPFSTALYPPDEPSLPAAVHIRRALGGPFFSFLLSMIAGLLTLATHNNTVWFWLMLAFFLDNFVLLTLQVFLPLGFNDGATLWHWFRRR